MALGAAMLVTLSAGHLGADPVVVTPPHNVLHRPMPGSTEWVTWAWKGDNARYINAEREVFKAYQAAAKKNPNAGERPKSVLEGYGAAACRNTSDPWRGSSGPTPT